MTTHTLPRSGQRPVSFAGERIASGDTQSADGPGSIRWWAVGIYRRDSGGYILALHWNTRWQGEQAHDAAIAVASLEAVADALEAHDPLSLLIGFPVSGDGKYAARQRHIEAVLRQGWAWRNRPN